MPIDNDKLKTKTRGNQSQVALSFIKPHPPQHPEQCAENPSSVNINVDVNVHRETGTPRQKKLFEQQYTRATFYIRNELLAVIESAAKEAGKGEKTRIINEALSQYFKR